MSSLRPRRWGGLSGPTMWPRRWRSSQATILASPPATTSRSAVGLQWIEWDCDAPDRKEGRLPMHTIDLTYAGRGIHEELVAYVADQEGYYTDEGVHVAIRDGVRWETERLRRGRDDRSGSGPVVLADRRYRLESAQRQHPSSAVLVSRARRGDIYGGSSRAPTGGP